MKKLIITGLILLSIPVVVPLVMEAALNKEPSDALGVGLAACMGSCLFLILLGLWTKQMFGK